MSQYAPGDGSRPGNCHRAAQTMSAGNDCEKRIEIHVSRLICLPNLAYSSTFSCFISSRIDPSFSSSSLDSSSLFVVAVSSICCACSRGKWKNESPTLYLKKERKEKVRQHYTPISEEQPKAYWIFSSSSASSSSVVRSSSSSFSFCVRALVSNLFR